MKWTVTTTYGDINFKYVIIKEDEKK